MRSARLTAEARRFGVSVARADYLPSFTVSGTFGYLAFPTGSFLQNVAEAEEAFRLATLRFERGVGTQLEVSDAQLLQLTAQTNAARAAFDLYLATAEQARAEGRPIPAPPTTPSPTGR